ncbi:Vpu [Human immunodeficiency virus 1]|uniref:Protein Vpu n=1 Tax=Human immunodeficiency virus type 1 TaxID=11676 RepID=A0ZUW6_HV1|nr:Vpu [Human immunodeficiency virus 1]BAF42394.1 Vpu [Human immunodeficiency virus 1]
MQPLDIFAIVGLIIAFLAAIVVWAIVFKLYREIRKQEKIGALLDRIRERAEDSGNESEGDTEELAALMEMGNFDPWVGDNL